MNFYQIAKQFHINVNVQDFRDVYKMCLKRAECGEFFYKSDEPLSEYTKEQFTLLGYKVKENAILWDLDED